MPFALLEAHNEMFARLTAEEQLRAINAAGVGFNGGDGAREYVSELEERAHITRRKPKFANPLQAAAALGIPIKRSGK